MDTNEYADNVAAEASKLLLHHMDSRQMPIATLAHLSGMTQRSVADAIRSMGGKSLRTIARLCRGLGLELAVVPYTSPSPGATVPPEVFTACWLALGSPTTVQDVKFEHAEPRRKGPDVANSRLNDLLGTCVRRGALTVIRVRGLEEPFRFVQAIMDSAKAAQQEDAFWVLGESSDKLEPMLRMLGRAQASGRGMPLGVVLPLYAYSNSLKAPELQSASQLAVFSNRAVLLLDFTPQSKGSNFLHGAIPSAILIAEVEGRDVKFSFVKNRFAPPADPVVLHDLLP